MVRRTIKRPRLNSKKKRRNRARKEREEALAATLKEVSEAPNPASAWANFLTKSGEESE